MSRLLVLVCVVVFTDTMLFAAIVPLVPAFADTHDLSTFQVGLLVAAYGAGAMVGGIPSGYLAARIGAKATVVAGLFTLALASAAFALVGDVVMLGVTRFAQGLASAVTWSGALAWLTLTTPRERRGQILGTAFGFAILGFIIGPVIGAAAELTSLEVVFLLVAAATGILALVARTFPAGPAEVRTDAGLQKAFGDRVFVTAVWLTLLPAIFFGALDVLVPLTLDDAGWGTLAIAAAFVAAGLAEVALSPVMGALSDRQGRLRPIRLGLWGLALVALGLASTPTALLVAVLLLAASIATSGLYTPAMALVSDRAEANGVPQTLGFGVMNSAWAFGAMIGPAGAGALADGLGEPAPYVVAATLALLTTTLLVRPTLLGDTA